MDKPEIEFVEGPAPDVLVITDLVVGEGAEAMPLKRSELDKLIADDTVKWAQLAKQTGIKAE